MDEPERELSREEYAALEGAAVAANVPEPHVQDVPVTLWCQGGAAASFVVSDVDSWFYHDYGIWAQGHWAEDRQHRYVLIPYERLDWIEFHFDRLEQFYEAQAQARAAE